MSASKVKKLSAAQERALADLLAWNRPFRAFPPKYRGRFGTSPAHFAPTEYLRPEDHRWRPALRWATYAALVETGHIVETGRFPVDATEGPRNATGRYARLAHRYIAPEAP